MLMVTIGPIVSSISNAIYGPNSSSSVYYFFQDRNKSTMNGYVNDFSVIFFLLVIPEMASRMQVCNSLGIL